MLFLEHAPKLEWRFGNMLPYAEVMRKTGFRSVYCFSEADAVLIKAARNSRGFARFVPLAVELIIDLDSPDYVPEALANIKRLGWRYSHFESGSKGSHLHIPHALSRGFGLPARHREMALLVSPNADISLYRNNSIVRLPGTLHQKTGKPKQMVGFGGTTLCPMPAECAGEPENASLKISLEIGSEDELSLSLGAVQGYLGRQPETGRRYMTLWSIARGLADGGLSSTCVRELIEKVNSSWDSPKEESEITRVITDVYRI